MTETAATARAGRPAREGEGRAAWHSRWWIHGLLALGVVGFLSIAGRAWVPGTRASTDQGPEGTAALAGVLRSLDLPVRSLRVGLGALALEPPGGVLVVVVSPELRMVPQRMPAELRSVRSFLEKGSTALVLTDRSTALLEAFGVSVGRRPAGIATDADPRGWALATPVLLESLSVGGELGIQSSPRLVGPPEATVLFEGPQGAAVLSQPVGAGRLITVGDPSIATNRAVGRAGNLDFLVASVRGHIEGSGRVLFDDLAAGASAGRGVLPWIRQSGSGAAVSVLLLLLLMSLARYGTRFGVLLPVRGADGMAEDVGLPEAPSRAIGRLYERAELYGYGLSVVARPLRDRLEELSCQRWGSPGLEAWVVAEFGAQAGHQLVLIRRELTHLLSQELPAPQAVLGLVERIDQFERARLSAPRR